MAFWYNSMALLQSFSTPFPSRYMHAKLLIAQVLFSLMALVYNSMALL